MSARRPRRLSQAQLGAAIARMDAASAAHYDGDRGAFERWLATEGGAPARLELPLGELLNARIRGFAWAWAWKDAVRIGDLTKADRFDAQGLEGKAVVETSLATALLAARDLPPRRVAVYAADVAARAGERG